jgi:hypothetical protein
MQRTMKRKKSKRRIKNQRSPSPGMDNLERDRTEALKNPSDNKILIVLKE